MNTGAAECSCGATGTIRDVARAGYSDLDRATRLRLWVYVVLALVLTFVLVTVTSSAWLCGAGGLLYALVITAIEWRFARRLRGQT